MIPVKTDDCNFTFYLPGGSGENRGDMACHVTDRTVTSFWLLEHDDPIDTCGALHVLYTAFAPKTELGFGAALAEADMREYEVGPVPGTRDQATGMQMTDELRKYLGDGGRFILRTHMRPPPPVAVYLA